MLAILSHLWYYIHMDKLYTLREASEQFNLSLWSLRKFAEKNWAKTGRDYLITEKHLVAFEARNKTIGYPKGRKRNGK